ncbi:CDC27 family protein [Thalassotalea sp. 1_MG-2023]|uniref:tetratricopeptide repeat protein n=1 Tax=Thalassotalea sp. 1_MG-2023 TaxID=3062680 RepID=UPI0026E45CC0|nr:CDC27 family protein [Thalassotalea sp. 1_MG-2023]MDO6427524.1 CDC27 family protein [Thalassotalea sp. 1_MG-2023]
MKSIIGILLSVSALYAAPTFIVSEAKAEEQRESVRVPAMRNRVYTQLARAQQIADEGDKAAGLAVLDEVKSRIDSMNSYEKAMLWNFYGFMYYADENTAKAVESFNQVIAEQAIPESLRMSTLYSLAQLSMQQQDYKQTLNYLTQWKAVNTKALTPQQHVLFAQVYYQAKHYKKSLTAIENAVALTKQNGELPKENWLVLQRANYYELKQPEKVTEVMELMVKLFSKPEYWLQLAGMYGEIGREDKQMGAMESAWQAGFITKSQDIITLAQLYRYNNVPYKAAVLLEKEIAKGNVIANEKHLEMLAQSLMAAKEDQKAIPVLVKAAEIADSGKFDAQLAQAYLNTEKWQLAIDSAENAIERGGVTRVGDMHLIVGMSHFNLKNFSESMSAFEQAEQIKASAKSASQWLKYVAREKLHHDQLAMLN